MLAHMFRFMGLRGVRAAVRIAEAPIVFDPIVTSRKRIAIEARAAVCALGERGCAAELMAD